MASLSAALDLAAAIDRRAQGLWIMVAAQRPILVVHRTITRNLMLYPIRTPAFIASTILLPAELVSLYTLPGRTTVRDVSLYPAVTQYATATMWSSPFVHVLLVNIPRLRIRRHHQSSHVRAHASFGSVISSVVCSYVDRHQRLENSSQRLTARAHWLRRDKSK